MTPPTPAPPCARPSCGHPESCHAHTHIDPEKAGGVTVTGGECDHPNESWTGPCWCDEYLPPEPGA
jgi:hypothetical protein